MAKKKDTAFRDALAWCESVGRVEIVAWAGGKFVINREIVTDAA